MLLDSILYVTGFQRLLFSVPNSSKLVCNFDDFAEQFRRIYFAISTKLESHINKTGTSYCYFWNPELLFWESRTHISGLQTPPLPLPLRGGERLRNSGSPYPSLQKQTDACKQECARTRKRQRIRRYLQTRTCPNKKATANKEVPANKNVPEQEGGSRSPPLKGRGRGGVCNITQE